MKVSHKLQLSTLSSVIIGLLITLVIFSANRDISRGMAKNVQYQMLVNKVFELDVLSSRYLKNTGEPVPRQWSLVSGALEGTLGSIQVDDPNEMFVFTSLLNNYESVKTVFEKLLKDNPDPVQAGEVLSAQLSPKLTRMLMDANSLLAMNQAGILTSQKQVGALTLILLVAMILLNGGISLIAGSRIARSIARLRYGTLLVTQGRLDYKIDVTSNDEIGLLATAFNDMADRLQRSYDELKDSNRGLRAWANEAEQGRRTLEAIMEYIPEGITIAGAPDSIVRMVSRYGRELIGRPREQIEGISVAERAEKWGLLHADGVTRAVNEELPLTRATLGGEVVRDEEWVLRRPDGEKITILCNAGPIRDKEGNITGGIIAWRDINSLREAQEQLQKSHDDLEVRIEKRTAELKRTSELLRERAKELETIMDAVPAATWITREPDCRSMVGSRLTYELLRMTPGVNVSKTAPPGVAPTHYQTLDKDGVEIPPTELPVQRAARGMEIRDFEMQLVFNDGTSRYLFGNATPLYNGEGKIYGAVAAFMDITDRRVMEEERLRLERELLQAHKAESLTRMAGAIAHNFNNLLMAVMGNLELAMFDLPQEAKAVKNIAEAMTACSRAAEISRFMLTSIGQTVVKHAPLDLSKATAEALARLKVSLPEKIELKTSYPEQGPTIMGDGTHVRQILTNLVLNAGEAIGDAEGCISVSISVNSSVIAGSKFFPPDWEPRAQTYACMEVSDTGCGLAPEMQDKVFDPFFSTKFTGRGMGLPVILGLVRAHQGAITVGSRLGEGTTFRVYFPMPS